MTPQRLAALQRQLAHGEPLLVHTAPALDEPTQKRWRGRLAQRLGGTVPITFVADEELVGGAELHFPSAVLSFCWRDVLATTAREIADERARQ